MEEAWLRGLYYPVASVRNAAVIQKLAGAPCSTTCFLPTVGTTAPVPLEVSPTSLGPVG